MKNKLLVYLLGFLILMIMIGGTYLLFCNRSSITGANNSNFAGVLVPNYNDIRGTVKRNSETWVAAQVAIRIKDNKVTFFSQKDGLAADNTFDVFNHNDQIWFGSQGGASRYIDNENRFKTYLAGEANINFFEDPYAKILYASTFENFFSYNDINDQWTKVEDQNIPINVTNMVFTPKNIFGSSYPYALPVVVYNKDQKKWTKSDIPEFKGQQILTLFNVEERTFIYGRSSNYTGCSKYGKEALSIFFEYKNNQWAPVDILNKTFFNDEPSIDKVESQQNTVVFNTGISCIDRGIQPQKVVVDFSDQGIKIVSQTERSNQIAKVDYASTIEEIFKITGLRPHHEILMTEGDTVFTKATNIDGSFSLTQVTLDNQNYSEKELISNKDLGDINILNLNNCSSENTKYLSAANISGYDGSGKNHQLYEIKGSIVRKVNADVSIIPLDNPNQLTCSENNLYWVEDTNIKKANIQGDKISIEMVKDLKELSGTSGQSQLSKDGKLWFSYYDKKDKIFSFDFTSNGVNEYNIPLPLDSLTLMDVTSDYFWFKKYLNPSSELVKIDRNGNIVKRYAVSGSLQGFLNIDKDKYLISSDEQVSLLSDDSLGVIKPINDKLLAFYSEPANFMGGRSNFKLYQAKDNILFVGETGNFTIPVATLLK